MDAELIVTIGIAFQVCCNTATSCRWFGGLLQHGNQLQLVGGLLQHSNQLQLVWGLLQHGNQLQLAWGSAGLGVCCSTVTSCRWFVWGSAAARQNAAVGYWGLLQHSNQLQVVCGFAAARTAKCCSCFGGLLQHGKMQQLV